SRGHRCLCAPRATPGPVRHPGRSCQRGGVLVFAAGQPGERRLLDCRRRAIAQQHLIIGGRKNVTPFTTRPELKGTFGMVASTHWLARAAGMAVLERGGNAYDAAVAAGPRARRSGRVSLSRWSSHT